MNMHRPLIERIRENAEKIRTIVAAEGASNPRVFGSVARGEDTPKSDVDLIVDKGPSLSIFGLAGIEIELERILGVPVDVLVSSEIPDNLRSDIVSQALQV